jgi:16S rRNA (cytidine1402-2'-O)-methyltransferase
MSMSGRLFVVATPLGNLEDLSPRARRVLGEVALIACEDTRRTGRLLQAHGLRTPTTSYFEHNERSKGARVLAALRAGQDVALVSDAGTPAISDPGYRLVRDARAEGLPVIPVPGPSAAVTALSVSGLPSDRFLFVGFLPPRTGARRRALLELRAVPWTLVVYESPLRVPESLRDAREVLGDRPAFLCREATKLHEEYLPGTLSELEAALGTRDRVRGEIVLVIAGTATDAPRAGSDPASAAPEPTPPPSPEELFERLVAQGRTRREAVKEVARTLGLHAREVYARVLDTSE